MGTEQKNILSISIAAIIAAVMALIIMAAPSVALADAKSDLDDANKKATAASEAYDKAVKSRDAIDKKIKKQDKRLSRLEKRTIPSAQERYNDSVRQLYVGGADILQVMAAILSGESFSQVISTLNSLDVIAEWRQDALMELKDARAEAQAVKNELKEERRKRVKAVLKAKKKKKAALAAQEKARKAYQDTLPQNVPSTMRAPTATSFHDEASARAFIVNKESGGNYNARNGRYYGAYQLTSSYLHGDYSPANQDRTAERYVKGRYGSWVNAANFWLSHHWY